MEVSVQQAFPMQDVMGNVGPIAGHSGMTLRDYFAAAALAGYAASSTHSGVDATQIARAAWDAANAMIELRVAMEG